MASRIIPDGLNDELDKGGEINREQVQDFFMFLQGNYIPEGFVINQYVPKLTPDQSFTVILVLQEWLGVIPDKFELCAECGSIFDADHGMCHVDDKDDLEQKIEMGYRVTKEDIGKTFCGDCR